MKKDYDLIVIGSGIASVPARKCVKEGWSVALIDEKPPGGTCALRGCTPKKYLRTGAEIVDLIHRMDGKGISKQDTIGSWQDLQKHRYEYTDPIPENNKKIYEKSGIDFFGGRALLQGPHQLQVLDSNEQPIADLHFKKLVIATGARAADLPIHGSEHLVSSDDFLELESLPKSMIFVGGGFISMEYAHIAARFGVDVKVVQRGDLPLKSFEPELVQQLVDIGKEHAGVDVLTHRDLTSIEKTEEGNYKCQIQNRNTQTSESIEADLVVHGAGRVPNIDQLNLELAEIAYDKNGVLVNDYLQSTTQDHVFAAGDCTNTGAPQLSFTASREGLAVSKNILEGLNTKVNYAGQASVAFTLPGIAQAGLLESQAKAMDLDYEVQYHESQRWFTNRRLNEGAGAAKIILEKDSGKILGAHFLAHHCEEFINVFALAIHHGMTRDDLKSVPWAHPTSASDLSRLLG